MKKEKLKLSILSTAILAAVIYGSWAGFTNSEHGFSLWIKAALAQGVYAFISTLSITHIAKFVFLKFKCGLAGIATGFLASFFVMIAIPLLVHNAVGTPDIWEAILPGMIWGSIYLAGFLISLDVKMRIAPKQEEEQRQNAKIVSS